MYRHQKRGENSIQRKIHANLYLKNNSLINNALNLLFFIHSFVGYLSVTNVCVVQRLIMYNYLFPFFWFFSFRDNGKTQKKTAEKLEHKHEGIQVVEVTLRKKQQNRME